MNQNPSTTQQHRANSIPNCSKYLKGGNRMSKFTRANSADFSSIFAGTGIERTYPAEFDITTENYGDDGCDNIDALNGMYDQIEAEEMAYYSALFPEEEGDENEPSEEVEMILNSITRDENHYQLLKKVHERARGLSS